jgi:hypothetical protein
VFELRHLSASRASAEAISLIGAGLRREMLMQQGMRGEFERAVQADPTFAYGHAALAGLDVLFGRNPASNLAAALAHADRASEPERATIAFVQRCASVEPNARYDEARSHLAGYPVDILAVLLGVASVNRGLRGPQAAVDILEQIAPAHSGHWWVKGVLATFLVDVRRVRDAWSQAHAALSDEPAAWHAAHAVAHITYTTNDHSFGADWLGTWRATHKPVVYANAHLAWHEALGRIATGDVARARQTMLGALTPQSPDPDQDTIEFATASWLCLVEGDPVLARRLSERVQKRPDALIRLVSPMRTVAAGMLFAGAGMRSEIGLLDKLAADARSAVYQEVVRPLLAMSEGLVDGDSAAVTASLAAVTPEAIARLGGSVTEQDVLERCLLFALQRAMHPGPPDSVRVEPRALPSA